MLLIGVDGSVRCVASLWRLRLPGSNKETLMTKQNTACRKGGNVSIRQTRETSIHTQLPRIGNRQLLRLPLLGTNGACVHKMQAIYSRANATHFLTCNQILIATDNLFFLLLFFFCWFSVFFFRWGIVQGREVNL